MRAGKLRHRVTVQRDNGERSEFGGPEESWSDVTTRWMTVEPLSGRELWNAQQVRPDVTHKVTARHLDGVTTKHRLKFGTRVLQIESVINPVERNEELMILCKELV